MLDKAFDDLKKLDWGSDPKVLVPIDEAIVATHGDANGRKELEQRLLAVLTSDVRRAAKDFVFRKLKVIGTAASVPTLAALLPDADYSHMARYALESMPAPEAGKALLAAVSSVNGKLKAGVISSLGDRQDDDSVPALTALVSDADPVVARAAALALGDIRSPAAAKALNSAKPSEAAVEAAVDSSLACAESLLADGNKVGALAIYRRLAKGGPPKHVKLAATRGILACAGKAS